MKIAIPIRQKFAGRRGLVQIVFATMVLFPVALGLAIGCYPGQDAAADGYCFSHEFISALGMTRTPGGLDNHYASLIFNVALGSAMLILIPYWYVRSACVRGPWLIRWLTFFCCAGFSLGVFGVALTPYDLRPDLHNTCIYSAFALIIPGVLLLLLGSDQAFAGWRYKVMWALFAIGLLLGEWVLVKLVSQHILSARPVTPVLQKVNVAVFWGWMAADLWLFKAYLIRRDAVPA